MLHDWPVTKAEVQKELEPYLSFRDEIAVIDRTAMKGIRMIVLVSLQDKALKQVHQNHIAIEKARLLAHESIYWINMNENIEEAIKNCLTVLTFRKHDQRTKQCHMKY